MISAQETTTSHGWFEEPRAKFYAAEVLLALEHLHLRGVVHRDVKLENVLVDAIGHVAVTDFGLSKDGKVHEDIFAKKLKTVCGTPEYIAPEVLTASEERYYNAMADWWSFGIFIYEMLHATTPFYRPHTRALYKAICRDKPRFPPDVFSTDAARLLQALLTKDPNRRPNADKIKRARFFSDMDFDLVLKKLVTPPFAPQVDHDADTRYVPNNLVRNDDNKDLLASNASIVTKEPLTQQKRLRRRKNQSDDASSPNQRSNVENYASWLVGRSPSSASPSSARSTKRRSVWHGFEYSGEALTTRKSESLSHD